MFLTRMRREQVLSEINDKLRIALKQQRFVLLKDIVKVFSEELNIPASNIYHYVHKVVDDPMNGFELVKNNHIFVSIRLAKKVKLKHVAETVA